MSPIIQLILYGLAKFCLYFLLCLGLTRLFRLRLSSRWNFAIVWSGVRLLIGIAFGFLIVLAFATMNNSWDC